MPSKASPAPTAAHAARLPQLGLKRGARVPLDPPLTPSGEARASKAKQGMAQYSDTDIEAALREAEALLGLEGGEPDGQPSPCCKAGAVHPPGQRPASAFSLNEQVRGWRGWRGRCCW